jgi:hypothetical protein
LIADKLPVPDDNAPANFLAAPPATEPELRKTATTTRESRAERAEPRKKALSLPAVRFLRRPVAIEARIALKTGSAWPLSLTCAAKKVR